MRITRLVAGTVTAGLLGITPIAIAAPSHATENLTTTTAIAPSETGAVYGDEFYVNGSVIGSDGGSVYQGTVTLWRLPADAAAWEAVVTDTASGYLGFYDLKADGNAQFKITYSGYAATNAYENNYAASESLPFALPVARKLTIKNPKGTFIKGKVSPKYAKKKVLIHKKVGKKWKKFRTLKTNKKSRFETRLPATRKRTFFRFTVKGNSKFASTSLEGSTIAYRSTTGRVVIH